MNITKNMESNELSPVNDLLADVEVERLHNHYQAERQRMEWND